MQQNYWNQ